MPGSTADSTFTSDLKTHTNSTHGKQDSHQAQKLFAQAESAKEIGNLEEAAAFAAKIQELLQQHNLSMSDVENHQHSDAKPISEQKLSYGSTKSDGTWEIDLMSAVCQYNWCDYIWYNRTQVHLIIGKEENVEVVKYLYNFIRHTLVVASKLKATLTGPRSCLIVRCGFVTISKVLPTV